MKYNIILFVPTIISLLFNYNIIQIVELLFYILILIIFFNIGYILPKKNYAKSNKFKVNYKIFEILSFSLLIYFFLDYYLITGSLTIKIDIVSSYRSHLTEAEESHILPFIFLSYLALYSLGFYTYYFWGNLNIRKYIYTFIILYFSILSSGRSTFIILFSILLFGTKFKYKKISHWVILCSISTIVYVLFNLYGELTGKTGEGFGAFTYFLVPSRALKEIYYNLSNSDIGTYKLTFLKIRKFFDDKNYSTIVPYIYTPEPTNAYTFFGVLINDFNKLIIPFFFIIIGYFSKKVDLINQKLKTFESELSVSILSTLLALSCFHDYLTTSTSLILIIIIFNTISLNVRNFRINK